MRLLRRDPVLRGLREQLRQAALLEPGEHLLSWASLAVPGEALHVVASDRALLAPGRDGWERVPWPAIDKVRFGDDAVLQVTEAGAQRARAYPLATTNDLPLVVRARVEASIAWSQHHPLTSSSAGVLVVARREPAGGLRWSLTFDPGVDTADPAVTEEAARLLHAARASAGQ